MLPKGRYRFNFYPNVFQVLVFCVTYGYNNDVAKALTNVVTWLPRVGGFKNTAIRPVVGCLPQSFTI